jgi:hypothetical protein
MPAPARTPLGAATTVRKWWLDVNTGTSAAPVWVGVFGMKDFKPNLSPTWKDSSDFDSQGDKSQTATARDTGVEFKVARKTRSSDATAYDPGQEALRLRAEGLGVLNSIEYRFYEMEPGGPRVEAYQGTAGVEWSPEGGAMDDLDDVSVKLIGQGRRVPIAHPDAGATPAPTVTGLAPSSAAVAGGDLIMVTGSGFTTVTAVQVDGVAVPTSDWEIASDTKIALKAPAHVASAGGVDVTVTSPSGTSAASASSKLIYA